MMTPVTNHAASNLKAKSLPATPKHAARRRATVDQRLDTDLFKALSDPTRVRLLACLLKCSRPCSVTEIAECCSVDFSVVARHLSTLARAGVLIANKEGRTVWYSACCDDLCTRLRQLADAIEACAPTEKPCCEQHGCCTP